MTTTASAHQHLLVERRDAVTVMSVHRPDVMNALNRATLAEIEACVAGFVADDEQGALIVTGSGEKSFISGADIQELAVLDPKGAQAISRFGQRVLDAIEQSPKPVIAAINGYAFGGGCELALACHVRLASDNAVMGLPEVGLGIIPGYGGTQRLPRLVGRGRALELIMSGRRVKADEAERIGLVNRVVPRAELLAEAEALARSFLKNGPLAVAAALEAVHRGLSMGLDEGQRLESGQFGILAASEDMHEGLNAFLEKRPARFHRR
ncbi:MAG: enoyl-CoA hydratase/isomerase family protein [Candidatus Eisenbacteria bacterium]|uniref:Enoyl-CoA hydratase/isomerase family protein n=1 Tax=Eiseniibacteriota bacterium TaxID=2212470 RepID=A0A9D6L9T9_UNCEI|nr:enoyl-CoA hydratase/isomerase family protein [Candidatus Eisenbacteria bacterium]MBI3539537.1 enoyl-CoA hydratase/isomerase family protein [Candidatus Eisenbacteria bacterium]